ncbi:MAG: DUF3159 domain-containing protein [Actinobacteria bacterium]|nr:DUF3159 domain-containing protein [Actinomycetota bacterium]
MTNPLGGSVSKSALTSLVASETLTAGNLFSAVGGVRGVIESTAPGFLFLVVFTITGDLFPSVIAPVAVAIVILLTRLFQRLPVLPAVSGGIGIALSAGFALWTGRAEDNFVGGFIINTVSMLVMLVSIVIRRPLIGVVTNVLVAENPARTNPIVRRAAYLATVVWACFFGLRLAVQIPLYLSHATGALAATKLLMGVPLYAALLWVTWLMMRSALSFAAR